MPDSTELKDLREKIIHPFTGARDWPNFYVKVTQGEVTSFQDGQFTLSAADMSLADTIQETPGEGAGKMIKLTKFIQIKNNSRKPTIKQFAQQIVEMFAPDEQTADQQIEFFPVDRFNGEMEQDAANLIALFNTCVSEIKDEDELKKWSWVDNVESRLGSLDSLGVISYMTPGVASFGKSGEDCVRLCDLSNPEKKTVLNSELVYCATAGEQSLTVAVNEITGVVNLISSADVDEVTEMKMQYNLAVQVLSLPFAETVKRAELLAKIGFKDIDFSRTMPCMQDKEEFSAWYQSQFDVDPSSESCLRCLCHLLVQNDIEKEGDPRIQLLQAKIFQMNLDKDKKLEVIAEMKGHYGMNPILNEKLQHLERAGALVRSNQYDNIEKSINTFEQGLQLKSSNNSGDANASGQAYSASMQNFLKSRQQLIADVLGESSALFINDYTKHTSEFSGMDKVEFLQHLDSCQLCMDNLFRQYNVAGNDLHPDVVRQLMSVSNRDPIAKYQQYLSGSRPVIQRYILCDNKNLSFALEHKPPLEKALSFLPPKMAQPLAKGLWTVVEFFKSVGRLPSMLYRRDLSTPALDEQQLLFYRLWLDNDLAIMERPYLIGRLEARLTLQTLPGKNILAQLNGADLYNLHGKLESQEVKGNVSDFMVGLDKGVLAKLQNHDNYEKRLEGQISAEDSKKAEPPYDPRILTECSAELGDYDLNNAADLELADSTVSKALKGVNAERTSLQSKADSLNHGAGDRDDLEPPSPLK